MGQRIYFMYSDLDYLKYDQKKCVFNDVCIVKQHSTQSKSNHNYHSLLLWLNDAGQVSLLVLVASAIT